MDKLLSSRRSKENLESIQGLSPEKFGKGAYCQLTYTPSKLADNVLYREAHSLRRVEEEGSRCREFQTQNQLLTDQVGYLKQERDGIAGSLNEVIAMYKGIIADMESKADSRLKELQGKCNAQIQKLIEDKHVEARYMQSERELLEQRIEALENELTDTQQQLSDCKAAHSDSHNQIESLTQKLHSLQQISAQSEQKYQQELEKSKAQVEEAQKQTMLSEVRSRQALSTQLLDNEREKEALERTHRAQLERVEQRRKNELIVKTQELGEVTRAFEKEGVRLKEILAVKDRMIENLTIEGNREKSRVLQLTQEYEAEIGHLTHQKNRLLQELDCLGRDNEVLVHDRAVLGGELERENSSLRQLLMESSKELDRCRGELLSLGRQNGGLLSKLKEAEEEARTWRDSYYLNKTRAYS